MAVLTEHWQVVMVLSCKLWTKICSISHIVMVLSCKWWNKICSISHIVMVLSCKWLNKICSVIPYCHGTRLQMVKEDTQYIPYFHGTQLQMVKEYIPYCMGYTAYLLPPSAAEYHDYLTVFMHKILLSFHHILSVSHKDGCIWCLYLHSSGLLHWYWDYWRNQKDWERGMDK